MNQELLYKMARATSEYLAATNRELAIIAVAATGITVWAPKDGRIEFQTSEVGNICTNYDIPREP